MNRRTPLTAANRGPETPDDPQAAASRAFAAQLLAMRAMVDSLLAQLGVGLTPGAPAVPPEPAPKRYMGQPAPDFPSTPEAP